LARKSSDKAWNGIPCEELATLISEVVTVIVEEVILLWTKLGGDLSKEL
jgi:hypothetical protein